MNNAKALVMALWLSCLALPAQAMPIGYHFSYTFDSGEVLSGMLVGALQADNDTILVDSVSMVSFTQAPASGFSQIMIGRHWPPCRATGWI